MNYYLRLCFEPKSGVSIDDADTFQHLVENYLSGFDIEFAGYVAVASIDKRTENMQPLWQYLIRDPSLACRNYLIEYLNRNPMAGYWVHVYERTERSGILTQEENSWNNQIKVY